MKPIVIHLITAILLTCHVIADKPRMSSKRVAQLGAIILKEKNYQIYRGGFTLTTAQFDTKEKIWTFQPTEKLFPAYPGSPLYFFEIRDSDGYFRIGSISGNGYSPKSAEHFRMPPAIRRKLRELLK